MCWCDIGLKKYQGVTGGVATAKPVPDAKSYYARQVYLKQACNSYVNAESSKERLAMRAELQNDSCLGDLFSVNWMEDSDATDITSESLDEQAQTVIAKTSKSKVMNYGDDASDETFEFGGQSGE